MITYWIDGFSRKPVFFGFDLMYLGILLMYFKPVSIGSYFVGNPAVPFADITGGRGQAYLAMIISHIKVKFSGIWEDVKKTEFMGSILLSLESFCFERR